MHKLRNFNLPQELLIIFCAAIMQPVPCISITVWFGSAAEQDKNGLPQSRRSAGNKIIGADMGSS